MDGIRDERGGGGAAWRQSGGVESCEQKCGADQEVVAVDAAARKAEGGCVERLV